MGQGEIARGLGSAAVYAVVGGVVSATKVDIPGIQTLEVSADANTESLRGENKIIANAVDAPEGSGSMTWGRMAFSALAVVNGGTVSTSGVTPDVINKHIMSGDPVTNEFKLVAQTDSMDQAGSGYRITLPLAKAGPASETLDQQAYNTPSFDLQFRENAAGEMIIREQFETLEAIGAP